MGGYKPLNDLLEYWRIIPLLEGLPSKFHICPRSKLRFSKCRSSGYYRPKNISAAERSLFSNHLIVIIILIK